MIERLSPHIVAKRTGFKVKTIQRWCRIGIIECAQVAKGHAYRVTMRDGALVPVAIPQKPLP